MELESATVLITGGTSGLGAAAARLFAAKGARVIVAGRREDRLAQMAHEFGPRGLPLQLDVRDAQAVAQAIKKLPAAFAAIDVLINNAGTGVGITPAQTAKLDDWIATVETNVSGVLAVTHAVLPGMIARNRGHILNLGSTAAHNPQHALGVYSGSKAFLHNFTHSIRADLLGTDIRVSCLEPGFCESEFTATRLGSIEASREYYRGLKIISAKEIAEMLVWIVSLPAHINVNVLEVMPVRQARGQYALARAE